MTRYIRHTGYNVLAPCRYPLCAEFPAPGSRCAVAPAWCCVRGFFSRRRPVAFRWRVARYPVRALLRCAFFLRVSRRAWLRRVSALLWWVCRGFLCAVSWRFLFPLRSARRAARCAVGQLVTERLQKFQHPGGDYYKFRAIHYRSRSR
jgi:hypothetical protein